MVLVKYDPSKGFWSNLKVLIMAMMGKCSQTKLGLDEMLKVSADLRAASEKLLSNGSITDEATKELLKTAVTTMSATALRSVSSVFEIPMTATEEARVRTNGLMMAIKHMSNAHEAVADQAEEEIREIKTRVAESEKRTRNLVDSSNNGIKEAEEALVFCGEGA